MGDVVIAALTWGALVGLFSLGAWQHRASRESVDVSRRTAIGPVLVLATGAMALATPNNAVGVWEWLPALVLSAGTVLCESSSVVVVLA